MMRWGMPPASHRRLPVTNIKNTSLPQCRRKLKRDLVAKAKKSSGLRNVRELFLQIRDHAGRVAWMHCGSVPARLTNRPERPIPAETRRSAAPQRERATPVHVEHGTFCWRFPWPIPIAPQALRAIPFIPC
jgi:hypothetical protein